MTADTIGRVIRRVPAGTSSTSNPFSALNALSSGAFQMWLTSDLNLLGEESTYRMLVSVPGFDDILRPSPTGATSGALSPSDFDFMGSLVAPFGGGDLVAAACLGTHAIHRVATATSTWPKAVLRCRAETPASGADKLGYILVASPGRAGLPRVEGYAAGTLTGGMGWVDLDVELQLTDAMVVPIVEQPALGDGGSSGPGVIGESVAVNAATFWISFFSTGATKGQVVAITLSLEPA